MEASSAQKDGAVNTNALTPAELIGMVAAVVLVLSLFLPWFGTSDSNPNSVLAGASGGDTVTAFDVFNILHWLLIAAASAPFILAYIIARGHKLTWKPGEVTMVVGITAVTLILCNGIILGRPEDEATRSSVDISLQIGYFVGLIAALVMSYSGFMRQSRYTQGRKPPGVI